MPMSASSVYCHHFRSSRTTKMLWVPTHVPSLFSGETFAGLFPIVDCLDIVKILGSFAENEPKALTNGLNSSTQEFIHQWNKWSITLTANHIIRRQKLSKS